MVSEARAETQGIPRGLEYKNRVLKEKSDTNCTHMVIRVNVQSEFIRPKYYFVNPH